MTAPGPHEVRVSVAWGDMDAFEHVNNVVYLRWCETARIGVFERLGVMEAMGETGVGPILARATCDYLSPVTYPDQITVTARCVRVGNSSFDLSYELRSERAGRICARGDSTVVMVDYRRGGAVALSADLRQGLAALMTPESS